MVENSTNTQIWIEKYNTQTIQITNYINSNGSIITDNNNNQIGTCLQDNLYIDGCTKFTGVQSPYLLVYDDTQWCLIKGEYNLGNNTTSNIIGRYVLRQNVVPKYKVRATIFSANFDGNSVNVGSNVSSVGLFKVILNSKETSNYSINNNIMIFSDYKLFGNTITMIYYDLNQVVGGEINLTYLAPIKTQPTSNDIKIGITEVGTTVSTTSNNLKVVGINTAFKKYNRFSPIQIGNEIRYVDLVIDDNNLFVTEAFTYTYSSGTPYKSFPYINLITSEQDFTDTISRDFIKQNKRYLRNGFNKRNSETKNLTFSYFLDSNTSDIYNYPVWTTNLINIINNNEVFRIIITNTFNKETTFYINIKNNESESFAIAQDKNKMSVNVKFQDKVTIKEDGEILWGDGIWGTGSWGGYKVSIE